MKIDRREFVKLSWFAMEGLSLSSDLTWARPQAAVTRSSNSKRVAILGAGMAGLAAGWKLHSDGYDVVILEAQMRRGCRVHTIREGLSDDLYAEAGAGRIPRTHTVTLDWIKRFGLELEPFHPASLAQVALLKGKRVKLSTDGSVDVSLVPLDLTLEERRIGLANLEEHYFGEATKLTGDRIRDDWSPEIFGHLGEITASDFLRQKGASEDAIRYMLLGWEDNAAADYIKDVLNHNAAPLMKIKGGNDQLPRAIAGKLSDIIHYGCAVEHFERGDKRIRIAFKRAGMLDHVDAEAVICTIPYSVLRHIAVTPDWSPSKRNVIDNLYYSPAVRTTYQVSRRYWEEEGLNGFGTSDKNFEVWHPTFGKPGTRGILQAYNYEKYANHLDQLSENERIEQTIRDMDEVHPNLRRNLETVVIKSWATDPWQRGAYPFYRVGQIKWYADICKPEGGIWFAGDHASGLPGWIEGAITSGLKAARDVSAKLEVAT